MALTFGTYQLDDESTTRMVRAASSLGIMSYDTAQLYKNEQAVSDGLRRLYDITSSEPFITTKIHRSDIRASGKDTGAILKSLSMSAERLKKFHLNCVLLHSPEPSFVSAWSQLCACVDEGLVDFAGVSNFSIEHIQELEKYNLDMPVYNQIEVTPFNKCTETVRYCMERGIKITSHSCLTKGHQFGHPVVKRISESYGYKPSQVLINWCLKKDYTPIFRTSSTEHLADNVQKINMSDVDMQALDAIVDVYKTHKHFDVR